MPNGRAAKLQTFLDATLAAISARTGANTPAAMAMRRVDRAIAAPVAQGAGPVPNTFPVCEHLASAIRKARDGAADLARVAEAIEELTPGMVWRQRAGGDREFMLGHASSDIVGPMPEALEQRLDVRVGISLMAPGVTYPDHQHPPEEVYLALSDGDWRQGAGSWHTPGFGGIVYNPPDIIHAMRSKQEPLLAIWCLPIAA